MNSLLQEVGNNDTGILYTLNCKFVRDNLNFVYTDLCEDMFPNLAKLAVIFALFGFLAVGSSICSCLIGRRLVGRAAGNRRRP